MPSIEQQEPTEPTWESTQALTSQSSDELLLPEEKMADHEEQLSEEEKVRCPFRCHTGSGGDVARSGFVWVLESVCPRLPTSAGRVEFERRNPLGVGTAKAAAAARIIFSSTSAHLRLSNGGSLYGPD